MSNGKNMPGWAVDLFSRVRRIELILAFMAGAIALGGGSVGLKVFGVL